jgi:hypothetical protein
MKTNFVYITVNNNRTQALVDTGAVISCITEQHLRKVIKHYKHHSRRNWLNWRMNKYCVKPVICFMLDIVTHLAAYTTCLFLCAHLCSELLFFTFFYGDIWSKKISLCLRSSCIKCVSDNSKQYLVFIICYSLLY